MVLIETISCLKVHNMTKSDKITQDIPTIHFYGEKGWRMPEHFHVETLAERSSVHDWKINSHRHRDFCQFFFLKSGVADVWLDGIQQKIDSKCVVYVPALSVHGFVWSVGSEGTVVSVSSSYIAELGQEITGLQDYIASPIISEIEENDPFIPYMANVLLREYTGAETARAAMLEALIRSLIVWALRRLPIQKAESKLSDRKHVYYRSFIKLLESSFKEQLRVTYYADKLGITSTYLTRLCREITGIPTQQILHERLILEAKRNLKYTGRGVAEIAYFLGFEDPSYFTRFFKRYSGITPRNYRAQQNSL